MLRRYVESERHNTKQVSGEAATWKHLGGNQFFSFTRRKIYCAFLMREKVSLCWMAKVLNFTKTSSSLRPFDNLFRETKTFHRRINKNLFHEKNYFRMRRYFSRRSVLKYRNGRSRTGGWADWGEIDNLRYTGTAFFVIFLSHIIPLTKLWWAFIHGALSISLACFRFMLLFYGAAWMLRYIQG